MTTTASNSASRTLPKERASVIMASPATGHRALSSTTGGMSDTVIDEHFRRSLGKDYMNVFAPAAAQRQQQQTTAAASSASVSEPPPTDGDNSGLSGNTLVQILILLPSSGVDFGLEGRNAFYTYRCSLFLSESILAKSRDFRLLCSDH